MHNTHIHTETAHTTHVERDNVQQQYTCTERKREVVHTERERKRRTTHTKKDNTHTYKER